MAQPRKDGDPDLLKNKTKDDKIKEFNNRTGKHEHEKISKSLKNENDSNRKNMKVSAKRKYF